MHCLLYVIFHDEEVGPGYASASVVPTFFCLLRPAMLVHQVISNPSGFELFGTVLVSHGVKNGSAHFDYDLSPNLEEYSSGIGFDSQRLTSMHKIQKRTCNPGSTVLFTRAESFGSLSVCEI